MKTSIRAFRTVAGVYQEKEFDNKVDSIEEWEGFFAKEILTIEELKKHFPDIFSNR